MDVAWEGNDVYGASWNGAQRPVPHLSSADTQLEQPVYTLDGYTEIAYAQLQDTSDDEQAPLAAQLRSEGQGIKRLFYVFSHWR